MRLTDIELLEIKTWIHRNARQIELSMWQYFFEGRSKDAVINALSYYQNEDGGFGHALEADNWNPNSSPYTTLVAINILKRIHQIDMQHPMMKGIIRYLESGVFCSEEGWYFSIPSNKDHAHAPWWEFSMNANATEGIGITAELVGFLLQYAESDSELYKKAILLADKVINKLTSSESHGDMRVGGYIVLLDSIEKAKPDHPFDIMWLQAKVQELVSASIVRDTSRWVNYCVRPSEYITSPESRFYLDNKDIVEDELNYLINTRPKDGVWDITWSWFENNEKYAKEFAISENWWKAGKAIEKLLFLESFDRLELG